MNTAKTYSPRPRDIERRWYVVDADGAVLGRLASEVAKILRGKHKPIFAPHADTGDHVIVVNARGVRVTGGKENEKHYYRHSGYPGGLRALGYAELLQTRPALAVEKAIKGMLPKNRLGRQMATKLQVYEGGEHPHAAQKPKPLGLGEVPVWEGLPSPPEPLRKPPAKSKQAPAAGRGQRGDRTGPKGSTKSPRRRGEDAGPAPARPRAAKAGTAKASTAKASTAKRSTGSRRKASAAAATKEATPAAEPPATVKAPRRRRRSKEGSEES